MPALHLVVDVCRPVTGGRLRRFVPLRGGLDRTTVQGGFFVLAFLRHGDRRDVSDPQGGAVRRLDHDRV
jgi:hypothetical protein